MNPPQAGATKDVYLDATQTNTASVWSCPSLPNSVSYNATDGQWQIGYQYFGGIYWWYNAAYSGGIPSRSPTRLSSAKPGWTLAADLICKYAGASGNPWATVSGVIKMVAHQRPGALFPDGGNHLAVDGSVQWIKIEKTLLINSMDYNTYLFYFYQEDLGNIAGPTVSLLKPKL